MAQKAGPFQAGQIDRIFSFIEETVDAAILVDDQARLVWISRNYQTILGVPDVKGYLGQPVEKILPQSLMRDVVATGRTYPVDLFRIGARDYLVTRLPLRDEEGRVVGGLGICFKDTLTHMQPLIERIKSLQQRLNQAEKALAARRGAKYTFENVIGVSPQMVEVRRLARQAARLPATVLLLGETGTGKELIAHAIHAASPRSEQPFVSVNVAAIPETLLEAEFFGVAPGAYTGAGREMRPGKFRMADKGTLFLDEIGDMPPPLQAKLLRVLQEREVEPLGSNRLESVDVRIIAATSRDLARMVEQGSFRADLFYRLNEMPIRIPPLRERMEDIELLTVGQLERMAQELDIPIPELPGESLSLLMAYDWPGNVRELRNVLQQVCVRNEKVRLDPKDFQGILPERGLSGSGNGRAAGGRDLGLADAVQRTEEAALRRALAEARGNKSAAAASLGISRPGLYAKMRRFGLEQD